MATTRIKNETKTRLENIIKETSDNLLKNKYRKDINGVTFVPIIIEAKTILSFISIFQEFLNETNNLFKNQIQEKITNNGTQYLFKNSHIAIKIKPRIGAQEQHIRIEEIKKDGISIRMDNPLRSDFVQLDFGEIKINELVSSLHEYDKNKKKHSAQEIQLFSTNASILSKIGFWYTKKENIKNIETHHYNISNSEELNDSISFKEIAMDVLKTMRTFNTSSLKIIGKIDLP